ncbi:MAG: hypothetical protein V4695_13260 [Pseudomonadota bacterium]
MQQQEQYDEINTFRVMSARRIDWFKATVVEEAITLQRKYGTDFAAAFLKEKKVETDVAARVLANSDSNIGTRRQYSTQ